MMRPPKVKRANHRPRTIRFKSRLDIIEKKLKKKRVPKESTKEKKLSEVHCLWTG